MQLNNVCQRNFVHFVQLRAHVEQLLIFRTTEEALLGIHLVQCVVMCHSFTPGILEHCESIKNNS